MAGETTICVVGNLTADPELRFTPSGSAVANFTIASTPRTFDKQSQEFKDGETLFLRASVWRDYAEHVAESLTKGTAVVAQGRLKARSYEKDGQKRTSYELDVDEIGPTLRFATAKVTKANKGGGFNGNSQPANSGFTPPPASNGGQADVWGGGQSQGSWDAPSNGPAPF